MNILCFLKLYIIQYPAACIYRIKYVICVNSMIIYATSCLVCCLLSELVVIGAAWQERILRERLSQWMRMLEAGTPALSLRDVLVNVRRQDTSIQAVSLSKAERVKYN